MGKAASYVKGSVYHAAWYFHLSSDEVNRSWVVTVGYDRKLREEVSPLLAFENGAARSSLTFNPPFESVHGPQRRLFASAYHMRASRHVSFLQLQTVLCGKDSKQQLTLSQLQVPTLLWIKMQ